MLTAIDQYLGKVEANLRKGNATEHTHRPALKELLEALGPNVEATNEPQRIECGAPDFIITSGLIPVGYIEAKDVGAKLGSVAKTPQLKRYRESLSNLILTDYLSFHYYRNDRLVDEATLAKWIPAKKKIQRLSGGENDLSRLVTGFFNAQTPVISSASELAQRVAMSARLIEELVEQVYGHEKQSGELHNQYQAFKRVLISDLTVKQFADMYAQTIAYGLFAARANHTKGDFTRMQAGADLPKTNPFLRRLFNSIAGNDLDERISWAVDDLAVLLARSDMGKILAAFGKVLGRKDPVFHFYETFLAAYDPSLREKRGVYYTPEPAVQYIVNSIDEILQNEFHLNAGLATSDKVDISVKAATKKGKEIEQQARVHKVQILDPAAGTGTFLHAVINKIYSRFTNNNKGKWPDYASKHLLPRLFGFEVLMAPYAVAHLKLALQLGQMDYDIKAAERLGIYLTNALEPAHETRRLSLFAQWLAEEAAAAIKVKRDAPIMVVLGNPPYRGHSVNKGAWIEGLMTEYKRSPELKKRAQAKWLSNDYVKFIRFAQWRIQQTGYGVLGFVTSHSWLDNPTFLDMRASLMQTFDKLYIVNLHGNTVKNEEAPSGIKDENIFDIKQGVAICILVKTEAGSSPSKTIHYHEIWDDRTQKYDWLQGHTVSTTPWQSLAPAAPQRLFVPQRQPSRLADEYEQGWPITEIMTALGAPIPGFATQHDDFAISYTEEESLDKVKQLLATSTEDEARAIFNLCKQDQWKYSRAKNELTVKIAKKALVAVAYRPFDMRFSVYNRNVLTHRRERISRHMLHENVALTIPKNAEAVGGEGSQMFFVVDRPADLNLYRRGGAYLLPLYVYPDEQQLDLLGDAEKPQENIDAKFRTALRKKLGTDFSAQEIFAYIYAIFWSRGYADRYNEFLNRGFARVPITGKVKTFSGLAALGQRLLDLHLLRCHGTDEPDYPVQGSDEVVFVRRDGTRVYINDDQYFDGISDGVWNLEIGAYPVAYKWLNDRKGRTLLFDDQENYQQMVGALNATLNIQQEIERVVGSWPLK